MGIYPDVDELAEPAEAVEQPPTENDARLLWLGVLFTLLPSLLYLYLRFSMAFFDDRFVVFLSVPSLVAGIACL